jgi:uncharacterized protein (TIGR00269 family)
MICKQCRTAKAVINLRPYLLSLCKDCFISRFKKQLLLTIKHYQMFSPEDHILLAVSGGKDSSVLWYLLTELGYKADGLYLDLGIERQYYSQKSKEYAQQLAQKMNSKLIIFDLKSEIGKGIPELQHSDNRKSCSLCGKIKRYYMNKIARENGYSCLATGHNLDDETAALLQSTLRWQQHYLGRQAPVLEERAEGFVKKVKPLVRFTEKEVALFAFLYQIPYQDAECPYARGATSLFFKNILNKIEDRSPGTKIAFYQEYLKIKDIFKKSPPPPNRCSRCGMPTIAHICSTCKIIETTPLGK